MQSIRDKRKEKYTLLFHTVSSVKADYLQLSVNRLSSTKLTNSTKYNKIFFGFIATLG